MEKLKLKLTQTTPYSIARYKVVRCAHPLPQSLLRAWAAGLRELPMCDKPHARLIIYLLKNPTSSQSDTSDTHACKHYNTVTSSYTIIAKLYITEVTTRFVYHLQLEFNNYFIRIPVPTNLTHLIHMHADYLANERNNYIVLETQP